MSTEVIRQSGLGFMFFGVAVVSIFTDEIYGQLMNGLSLFYGIWMASAGFKMIPGIKTGYKGADGDAPTFKELIFMLVIECLTVVVSLISVICCIARHV